MRSLWLLLVALALVPDLAYPQSFGDDVRPLLRESCVRCHGVRTVTPLNLVDLGDDLTDHETFQAWEKVYDRLSRGEMPPAAAPPADGQQVDAALAALKDALTERSLAERGEQRTPLRRLTRLEYAYTIQDLLGIDDAIASDLSQTLPAEADSGGFDTVAANQSMSPLHIQSYLEVADRALDTALAVGPPPPVDTYVIDYANSRYLYGISRGKGLGIGVVKELDDGYAMFFDVGSYIFHSMTEGVAIPYPGRYRVTAEAYPYQADAPVNLMVYRGRMSGQAASLDGMVGSFDLTGPRTIEVTPFLRPGELISFSPGDLSGLDGLPEEERGGYPPEDPFDGWGGMHGYPGSGIVLKTMTIEGPLLDSWPAPSTRALLPGVEFDRDGAPRFTRSQDEHLVDIVASFAPRAFRRPLEDGELDAYVDLGRPLLAEGRAFLEAVRVALRAVLSAPSFLYHAGSPGELDDFSLATRLSYFLWRSMPDAELFDTARAGQLVDPKVLRRQVDRMLDDPKAERFTRDFAGQAFRLYELSATSPDPGLYPEFDDRLARAMAQETQLFLAELVSENLGVGQLIDADFTFLNRRLAEHYDVDGVAGARMRRVTLPPDSPRGGLLTQASIHKITANGTTTSPIPRGNFVLSNLLGRPAPPPPAEVGALEPDTRGTTTIREQLDAHRTSPVCANCHRVIDPPGFALEAFDPIGQFRTRYRTSGGENVAGEFKLSVPAPFTEGGEVDPSGVTPDGDAFAGIKDYKRLLLEREVDQVARHLASSLLVFGTGAEQAFADRDTVEAIVSSGRDQGHQVRTMIHEVVQSDLFRRR
ncbi:MAG: hypothetical protein CL483_05670 [Acidobacteria bacterium]|nr:hypothetical protein [Acidobacteriota bacterium]